MKFIRVHNLDRNLDEQINAEHIARIRDLQGRDPQKCALTFNSGDTLTARGTADDILAMIVDTAT